MSRLTSWIVKPSTRAFAREARNVPGMSWFDRLHGYVYGRWLYPYISIGTGRHRLSRTLGPLGVGLLRRFGIGDLGSDVEATSKTGREPTPFQCAMAEGYHAKVVRLDDARVLVTMEQEVVLKDLEQVIPYAHARDIILRNPDHIVALECPCRATRENPCHPLDVCIVVGEPFASFITDHHPDRTRWITQDEAAGILRDEHERGHVHHAFFKDAMLGRFYAICNCCSCCCGAMNAWRNGTPMLASSGYVCDIDTEECIACEDCIDACQFGALSMGEESAVVDEHICMGCGVCISRCEMEASTLVRDPSRGEPLALRELMASEPAAPLH